MEKDLQKPNHTADPTSLTTQNLWREIEHLKELLKNEIEAVEKAVAVAHADLVRVPTDVQERVSALKELIEVRIEDVQELREEKFKSVRDLIDEKFMSIQTQFKERDVRVEQTARDTKVAVDAALMAAEKAVGKQTEAFSQSIAKSEMATAKQIDQQSNLITTITKSFDDKITDLKDRLGRIEGIAAGALSQKVEQREVVTEKQSSIGLIIAIIFGAFGVITGIVGMIMAFNK